ncbi:MAG TPA: hypothetical protein VMP68_09165 [Candidatus Eisenbacteria bacterium]|nr:hypothetical protein [Candidatus Eisenbacteria bacterium]
MLENIDDEISDSDKKQIEEIQSKMEMALDNAIDDLELEGVCIMCLYQAEVGLRMAHISNIHKKFLVEAMKVWISKQESLDERDSIN